MMVKQLMSQREEVRAEANEECVKETALWTALPVPRDGESSVSWLGKSRSWRVNYSPACVSVCKHHCPLLGGIRPVHLLCPPAHAPVLPGGKEGEPLLRPC